MAAKAYTGPVAYQDGWHYAATEDGLGDRLALEDDGTYRVATATDESWHDRKHQQFVLVDVGEMQKSVPVSADEMAEIQKMLDERRGG